MSSQDFLLGVSIGEYLLPLRNEPQILNYSVEPQASMVSP